MGALNVIIDVLRAIFQRQAQSPSPSPPPPPPDMPPPPPSDEQPVRTMPTAPSPQPAPVAPPPTSPAPASSPPAPPEIPCTLTVNADVGIARIRSGPGLSFDILTRTQSNRSFVVLGVSAPDADGFPWYLIDLPENDGWIRSDLITLGPGCEGLRVIDVRGGEASPVLPPPPDEPDADDEPETVDEADDLIDAVCTATIKDTIKTARIRSGPGTTFSIVERASAGKTFGVGGISGPDRDDFRWYWLDLPHGNGWIRGDLIVLSGDCSGLQIVQPPEPEPPQPPPPTNPGELFPLPTRHPLTQGFHNNHKGYDLGSPEGTTFFAPTHGIVIREVRCLKCTEERPNIRPSTLDIIRRNQIFSDPAWGFGYGNFIIVRYDYADVPRPLQLKMDEADLTGQFAYVLYAHLKKILVNNGQAVEAGTILGETGNTGHSSGPHLHLEVKIGRDKNVDGRWRQQIAVHPSLMFRDN